MNTLYTDNESAISRGIKTVGVGKKGSKPLSAELAQEILLELKNLQIPSAAQGAFFAALFLKGITPQERLLENCFQPGVLNDAKLLVDTIASDAPDRVREICSQLLQGRALDRATAFRLGQFLMSSLPGDGARGIVASALRVRYETADEYEGLLAAMQETIEKPFKEEVPSGDPVIQFSEPFDGVDHSYLITPLLSQYVQGLGYRAINMTGRNSGPKNGINLWDVAQTLGVRAVSRNKELGDQKPILGWFMDQQLLSKAMDGWVALRKQTIKRPFMATLEKFLNPAKARIIVTSAFHPPYTEKMITISERAGFPGAMVIRNGLEGTLAFPLKRPVKIMCSARQRDEKYIRHEFEFDSEKFLGASVALEEKLEIPNAVENADLIRSFSETGRSSNDLFDMRVKASRAGLKQAIDWIETNIDRENE